MQSRFWLNALSSILDRFLCGNRPGFQAATLWRTVLEHVELSQSDSHDQCGVVFDLEKAYNCLPRMPTLAAARIAGVHQDVLVAWSSALAGLERRFVVNGSYSPQLVHQAAASQKAAAFRALPCCSLTRCGQSGSAELVQLHNLLALWTIGR